MLLRTAGVLAYVAGMVAFADCMYEHEYMLAASILATCLISAPLLLDLSWNERLAGSAVLMFAFLGLLAGFVGFFGACYFPWFEHSIARGGPGVLGIFTLLSGAAGGWLGYRIVRALGKKFRFSQQQPHESDAAGH
jgi:hypothetical protein